MSEGKRDIKAAYGTDAEAGRIPVKGYLNEDFRLFHNTDTLGTDVDVHFHTFYKVTFVKYGKGSYMIDGRTYDIRPCDIILVGMNVPHKPFFEAGELYDRYTLYISAGMLEDLDLPDCHISELFTSESGNVVRPEGKETDHFVAMMERIEKETRSSSYAARLAARISVAAFLIETGRCRQESSLAVPLKPQEEDKMLNILRRINENLGKDISLEDIASDFGMSMEDMAVSFNDAFGCPVKEYITNRRLSRAQEMIMQGAGPAEACYECGYESYSEFAAAYKDKYGIPPKRAIKEEAGYGSLSDFLPE